MKILLINGSSTPQGIELGKLNDTLHQFALNFLSENNCDIEITVIKNGYVIEDEIQKILNADIVLLQIPIWWFGQPWPVKKYIDEVFSSGRAQFCSIDTRPREISKLEYGVKGLLTNKKYIINTTWGAPELIFNNKKSFMNGGSLDDILMPIYKQFEYIGMKRISGYHCFNISKNPNIDNIIQAYKTYLNKLIKEN